MGICEPPAVTDDTSFETRLRPGFEASPILQRRAAKRKPGPTVEEASVLSV